MGVDVVLGQEKNPKNKTPRSWKPPAFSFPNNLRIEQLGVKFQITSPSSWDTHTCLFCNKELSLSNCGFQRGRYTTAVTLPILNKNNNKAISNAVKQIRFSLSSSNTECRCLCPYLAQCFASCLPFPRHWWEQRVLRALSHKEGCQTLLSINKGK